MTRLIITEEYGMLTAQKEGDTGMCILGRGLTVLEAIGSWVLYSGKVEVICDPPHLKESRFGIEFTSIPKRD